MPTLYRIGASAYVRNRRSATSISPRAIDAAKMTGVRSMIRNRSRYRARFSASNPGAISPIVSGARISRTRLAPPMTSTASVSTVCANLAAAAASERRIVVNTGTNGAVSPAATRTSSASSGSWKAALYASSSEPTPNVLAKIRSRNSPAR
jgi:hypothetical protein